VYRCSIRPLQSRTNYRTFYRINSDRTVPIATRIAVVR
jgi:hypothetical protein